MMRTSLPVTLVCVVTLASIASSTAAEQAKQVMRGKLISTTGDAHQAVAGGMP